MIYYSRSLHATETIAARNNRCLALINAGRYAEAESDANVILAKDGENFKARLRRGWARLKLQRYDEATQDLNKCLQLEVRCRHAENG